MAPPNPKTPPPSDNHKSNISSFLQRMYNPSIARDIESRMDLNDGDLIQVPWKLALSDDENGEMSKGGAAAHDDPSGDMGDTPSVHYPCMSHLDLRRVQNMEWATNRLREGVCFAKEGKAKKAEECYQEGIDLVPTHAALFVAYGALCANLGRTREAMDKLEYAIELDPNVPNAQAYIDAIQNKVPPRQAGSVSRSQTAMKDALMEQSFLQESQSCADANEHEKYPLVHEEKIDTNHNHEEKDDKAKQKRRHKKAKKGKHRDQSRHRKSRSRRKRHKRHDSFSDDDTESDYSTSDNRHRRRRRRRHSSSSQESNRMHRPSTEETSEESNRRRRRYRKRHKRRRREYSLDASSDGSSDGEHMKRERRKDSRRQGRKSREESPASDRQGKGVK